MADSEVGRHFYIKKHKFSANCFQISTKMITFAAV